MSKSRVQHVRAEFGSAAFHLDRILRAVTVKGCSDGALRSLVILTTALVMHPEGFGGPLPDGVTDNHLRELETKGFLRWELGGTAVTLL